jgi:alanine dehydrogenase
MFLEKDYASKFGISDEKFNGFGGRLDRSEILKQSDLILVPKPTLDDFQAMKDGATLCGWAHLVQQKEITQVCIEKHLSVLAWESMHKWTNDGEFRRHIFHKNNEIAGYAAILDALRLSGIDGNYGPTKHAVIIGFGSVGRGAVHALLGLGFRDISVYTDRQPNHIDDQIHGVRFRQMKNKPGEQLLVVNLNGSTRSFIEELSTSDIIVNAIVQDTDAPTMFICENEVGRLKENALIVDVSCDEGMGFFGAKPTTFEEPMFEIGHAHYYAVDHTPSYLWNSASWEISQSLLPFLPDLMGGIDDWNKNESLDKSLEMEDGTIKNQKILTFQNRSIDYPHKAQS